MKRAPREAFQTLVKNGLRARLQSGNLLTGQLFVDLVMQPKSPVRLANAGHAEPELPTIRGGGFDQMIATASGIMEQLDRVDYAALGADLQGTLKGTNALANGAQMQTALSDLAASLASVRVILRALDARAEPIAMNLEQALAAARDALEKSRQTMALVDGAIAPDAPLHHQSLRLTQELAATARSLRHLVETLERNPQALLLGKTPAKDQEQK
jgi:paraquat-inducible protein B